MRTTTQVAIVAVAAVAAAAGWHYKERLPWTGSEADLTRVAAVPDTREVDLATVRVDSVVVIVKAVGTARGDEGVALTPKVTGLVESVSFEEGQWVEEGSVLLQLDSTALQAELAEAEAELANARQLHKRALQLLKTRNVPQARVDELQAQLAVAEAKVRGTKARMADYDIRAPFAGRLGLRNVSVGTLIQPGDEITTLDDTRSIKLDFEVPETLLAELAPKLPVTATSVAYPDREFRGSVVTVGSRVDPVTRAITVRARLPNSEDLLKPGMFLTVNLSVGIKENAILVPEEAILASPAGHYVFMVVDGNAVRRPILIGQRLRGEVEVLEGLGPDAEVVVGGVQKVRDGVPVRQRGIEEETAQSGKG